MEIILTKLSTFDRSRKHVTIQVLPLRCRCCEVKVNICNTYIYMHVTGFYFQKSVLLHCVMLWNVVFIKVIEVQWIHIFAAM